MTSYHSIAHMRDRARQRLPRFAFDFLDGGAGTETGLAENEAAFRHLKLTPRVLAGVDTLDFGRTLFGRRYALPFGAAPIGFSGMFWPGAEVGLAKACAKADIPYILSTAGCATLEETMAAAPETGWFQLYVGSDLTIADDLIRRTEAAGSEVLVVTVDIPVPGKRLRDMVNRFTPDVRPSLPFAWQVATHPKWAMATAAHGPPRFANMERYAPPGSNTRAVAKALSFQGKALTLDWGTMERFRSLWPGKFVIKGIMHPADAVRAVEVGADGIIVSNHGGRQLDSSPAPLEMLGEISRAVAGRLNLIVDGGVRSGEDVVKAIAMGADFVLLGRAFQFGIAALGPDRGAAEVVAMFVDDMGRTLPLIGCSSIDQVGPQHIVNHPLSGVTTARDSYRTVETAGFP